MTPESLWTIDAGWRLVFQKRCRIRQRFYIVTQCASPGHFSHTTPSPSPSLALGTIHLGKPLPLPLLPCMRVAPAACAASQELYVLISGVGVCCTGLLVGPGVWPRWQEDQPSISPNPPKGCSHVGETRDGRQWKETVRALIQ